MSNEEQIKTFQEDQRKKRGFKMGCGAVLLFIGLVMLIGVLGKLLTGYLFFLNLAVAILLMWIGARLFFGKGKEKSKEDKK